MKTIATLLSLLLSLLLSSCGQSDTATVDDLIKAGNLEAIRSKRKEIITAQQALTAELTVIDDAITTLDPSQKVPLITVIHTKDTVFNHYITLQGNVETKQNIVVYPETSGILTRIFVKKGQRVRKGQLLAKIDDGGMSQQLAQAEVQVALAKTTFDRQKRLWDRKIGSEIQFLQAKASFEAQQNAVQQIKQQLARSTATAPFSGIIDDVIAEQGSVVSAGQTALIRVVNLSNMYIEAEVPESHLPNVTKGKAVEVYFPVLDKRIQTTIRQVGNYINPNNRSFTVEIAIPNTDGVIKPNLTARVEINDYTNEKAILLPQNIISENGDGKMYVYTTAKTEGLTETKRVLIETGKTQEGFTEILEGISSGDAVVSEGVRSVRDGHQVKILN